MTERKSRQFETGATRDTEQDKFDYEGFFSPAVLKRRAEFMHKHRKQSDGKLRDPDNWQRGMPLDVYMKSSFRHFMDVWLHHRELSYLANEALQEALCALMFNIEGYLFEVLKRGQNPVFSEYVPLSAEYHYCDACGHHSGYHYNYAEHPYNRDTCLHSFCTHVGCNCQGYK